MQVSLQLPLQPKWRRGLGMPFEMSGPVQSVQVQGTVYVGGGEAGYGSHKNCIVMAYDINSSKWTLLPPYKTHYFAMTVISNQLVLVGGEVRDGFKSTMVGVWRADSRKWTHPYPDMSISRTYCSATACKQWLIVSGGYTELLVLLSSVEVLDTDTKVWHLCVSAPLAWTQMETAVVGDTCFFMGGYIKNGYTKKVYSLSLPALVSQLNSDRSFVKEADIWKEIPELPVMHSAPLSVRGSLLAIGGRGTDLKDISALYLYQPDTKQWVKVADMPMQRYNCTCVMTTDGEIMVAGGWGNGWLSNVDIAQII